MSKRTLILDPSDFMLLKPLTTVNTITVQPLPLALATLSTVESSVEVMLQGKPFSKVEYADIDKAENVGKFSIDTNNNLVFIVDNTSIQTNRDARHYIWGIVVIYRLKELIVADNIPTYICKSYNSDGYQISQTNASPIPEIMNKIKCLDNALNINETYYYHVLERNMI